MVYALLGHNSYVSSEAFWYVFPHSFVDELRTNETERVYVKASTMQTAAKLKINRLYQLIAVFPVTISTRTICRIMSMKALTRRTQ